MSFILIGLYEGVPSYYGIINPILTGPGFISRKAGEREVREVGRKSVRGRKSADRRKAGAACSAMHKYINMVLARPTPSDRKAQDLRAQGEKVTQAGHAGAIGRVHNAVLPFTRVCHPTAGRVC